jgi:serine/threonine protein kinase/Zn-dependent protease
MSDDPAPTPFRDTARNLLFGLLALQNNFISRDALVAAFGVWIADKSRPLDQLLLDRGDLDADCHALLTGLVRQHLKLHGNDPEKSLADLSAVGSVLRQLVDLNDPDLCASLGHVTQARPGGQGIDLDATSTPTFLGAPTSSGGRFQVLRLHAEGGLGEVYVARDEEVHRDVALKRIKDQHADNPQSRARFLIEAEITGGLEHPGIVPVYGLGTYDGGKPFYAMRFIRGESLKAAIARFHADPAMQKNSGQRTLALNKLLRRFLDVCNAVAYAHSRGVLHRDLKPGNIMLGDYGETLVVDWGLAKAVGHRLEPDAAQQTEWTLKPTSGSDVQLTVTGQCLGTPAYMPPEQAAGRLDELGAPSDVYSLGATLYVLLIGRPPFTEPDLPTLLRQVEKGDFPLPRQIRPWIDPALEAVCLKAMARRPQDRYPSPRALAEDIEHWLADEPVTAYPQEGMSPRRFEREAREFYTRMIKFMFIAPRLGRVAGISVRVHFTFLILIVWTICFSLLQGLLLGRNFTTIVEEVGFLLAVLGSVILHELGHGLASRSYGIPTTDIVLMPIGGYNGLGLPRRSLSHPRQELVVALAGPAMNLALVVGLVLVGVRLPTEHDDFQHTRFWYKLMEVNAFLALFNLVPAFPMDGGRVLRALLALVTSHFRATSITKFVGQFMAGLFGFLGMIFGNPILAILAPFMWVGTVVEAYAQLNTSDSSLAR